MSSALTPVETAVLETVARQGEAMLADVIAWSNLNSGSGNLSGLAAMAEVLAAELTGLGAPPAFRDPAPVEIIDASGEMQTLRRGRNLHLAIRPHAPQQIVLTGHMDTVYGPNDPFQTTTWRAPGVLNGPGVADMKGGLRVMLAALAAFEASDLKDQLGYQVVINSDEEVSSLGSAPLLAEAAAKAQIGLVFEPATDVSGTLASARKGLASFTLMARGRSAHAGRDPASGRNAVIAAADFAVAAARLTGAREGLTVNVARIDGGAPTNVVPDLALVRFEARVWAHEDRHWIEAELRQLTTRLGREHDLELVLTGRFSRPPKPFDQKTQNLFEAVRQCGADLGQDIAWKPSGGCCDGNNLSASGLAVVDTLGVRGGAIHSNEEFLIADSLVERAKLSALLLMRIASGAVALPAKREVMA